MAAKYTHHSTAQSRLKVREINLSSLWISFTISGCTAPPGLEGSLCLPTLCTGWGRTQHQDPLLIYIFVTKLSERHSTSTAWGAASFTGGCAQRPALGSSTAGPPWPPFSSQMRAGSLSTCDRRERIWRWCEWRRKSSWPFGSCWVKRITRLMWAECVGSSWMMTALTPPTGLDVSVHLKAPNSAWPGACDAFIQVWKEIPGTPSTYQTHAGGDFSF